MRLSVESYDDYCGRTGVSLLGRRCYEAVHWPTMAGGQAQEFRLIEVPDGITNRWFHLADPHRRAYVSDQQNIRFSVPLPQWVEQAGEVVLPAVAHHSPGTGLVVGGMRNHWHFLNNFLPRMVVAMQMLQEAGVGIDKVVIHEPSAAQAVFLEALFPDIDFVCISPETPDAYQFEKLIYLDMPRNVLFAEEVLDMTRRKVWAALERGGSRDGSVRRIFVDRDPEVPRRRLANRGPALKVLDRHGIQPVYCENYDFMGQVALFHGAEFLSGLHGAGMANMQFCRPGTPILVLDYKWPSEMYCMARVLGLKPMLLMAEQVPTEGAPHPRLWDLKIAPKQLDAAVTALLDLTG